MTLLDIQELGSIPMSCRDRLNAVGIFVGSAKYIAIF